MDWCGRKEWGEMCQKGCEWMLKGKKRNGRKKKDEVQNKEADYYVLIILAY